MQFLELLYLLRPHPKCCVNPRPCFGKKFSSYFSSRFENYFSQRSLLLNSVVQARRLAPVVLESAASRLQVLQGHGSLAPARLQLASSTPPVPRTFLERGVGSTLPSRCCSPCPVVAFHAGASPSSSSLTGSKSIRLAIELTRVDGCFTTSKNWRSAEK